MGPALHSLETMGTEVQDDAGLHSAGAGGRSHSALLHRASLTRLHLANQANEAKDAAMAKLQAKLQQASLEEADKDQSVDEDEDRGDATMLPKTFTLMTATQVKARKGRSVIR